jgi:acyl dehydratase
MPRTPPDDRTREKPMEQIIVAQVGPALPSPPEWFDDYRVGQTITSPTLAVTDDDVRAYVRFSNDVRPLLDPDRATGLPVPQLFLFSLGVGLLLHGEGGYIPREFVAFFGFETIDFHERATGGDVIRSTATVEELVPRDSSGLVGYKHETRSVSGALLVTSHQRILVRRDPADRDVVHG